MIASEKIIAACKTVKAGLGEDLCSYGWLQQIVKEFAPRGVDAEEFVRAVIVELLISGVEIGKAVKSFKDGKEHVAFVAWQGTVEERVERALSLVDSHSESDRGWAFCLCLPENVDEYESNLTDQREIE
jgi:hypothetical protein